MSEIHPRPVALITGSARRLGAALACHLHQQGMDLVLHYQHSGEAAEQLQAELLAQRGDSVRLVQADLSQPAQVRQLAARALQCFGRLDVLINNASQFFATPLASAQDDQWEPLFNTNVRAPYILAQSLADSLREQQGCIINITDIYAERPLPDFSLYSACKAALVSLTQSLALELAPDVRVNAIAPGAILWPDSAMVPAESEEAETAHQQKILARIALSRRGDPSDIARAAWYLIHEAPYVTGQVLRIDGGRSLSM